MRHIRRDLKVHRSALRRYPTAPESILWKRLRGQQFGVKFRRQHSIGPFILDFFAPVVRLGVEVDGDTHYRTDRDRVADHRRDALLADSGVRVLRFTNADVRERIDGVCERIARMVRERTPPLTPPQDEGED